MHFSDSNENHYYTYAGIAVHRLNAESMAVARWDIGTYRNYRCRNAQ
ncbi:hypothetical protein [Segatella paludivivens]|nr:hypothetical protein [Segatella paludivivens]